LFLLLLLCYWDNLSVVIIPDNVPFLAYIPLIHGTFRGIREYSNGRF
jgi:hypothetical protein